MKVILIKDHPKLGKKFDIKEVSPGYAKNFLLPGGIVIVANSQNMSSVNRLKEENKARDEKGDITFGDLKTRLEGVGIEIIKKANKGGKLFASVTETEIIKAIEGLKLDIGRSFKLEAAKHIKELGEHKITLLFGNKKIPLKLKIKEAK